MSYDKINNKEIITDVFSFWLSQIKKSLVTGEGTTVECGECRGCCISSYFIHIKPDEIETLSKIPGKLLFNAPGMPKGTMLLGFDTNGHCPMFINNNCSIYQYRPNTCRIFDCRVLTAAGLSESKERKMINKQVRNWKFVLSDRTDHDSINSIKMACRFILENEKSFPHGFVPQNAIQQAVLAIKVNEIFLKFLCGNNTNELINQRDKIIELIIDEYKRFENKKTEL